MARFWFSVKSRGWNSCCTLFSQRFPSGTKSRASLSFSTSSAANIGEERGFSSISIDHRPGFFCRQIREHSSFAVGQVQYTGRNGHVTFLPKEKVRPWFQTFCQGFLLFRKRDTFPISSSTSSSLLQVVPWWVQRTGHIGCGRSCRCWWKIMEQGPSPEKTTFLLYFRRIGSSRVSPVCRMNFFRQIGIMGSTMCDCGGVSEGREGVAANSVQWGRYPVPINSHTSSNNYDPCTIGIHWSWSIRFDN